MSSITNILKSDYVRALYFGTLLIFMTYSTTASGELTRIEHQLIQSEAQIPDIVDGAQKAIEWFKGEPNKTKYSIVYLHGFSASRKEISPIPEALAAKLGANIFFARLRGHGRDGDAMLDGTIEAWLEDTKEAYRIGKLIGERVIVIGTSTGATLGTWLGTQSFASDTFANIMISPNFALANDKTWVLQSPIGLWLVKKLQGEYRGFTPTNDYHAKYWTESYPVDALVPMLDLVDMVDEIDKSKITIPQLMIYSPKDTVISVNKAEQTIKEFTNARTHSISYEDSIDPGNHVLFGYGSSEQQIDQVSQLMYDFIKPEKN